jgi:site-specific DNA-cytosine methylase
LFAAIDIIIGGPPCADFSGLNAYGEGTKGAQGQLLPKFGELINAIQAHKKQQNKPLFFLVENVVFCKEAFDNYNVVEKAIGTTHTIWDAKYFSPCQRKRSYWLNVSHGQVMVVLKCLPHKILPYLVPNKFSCMWI